MQLSVGARRRLAGLVAGAALFGSVTGSQAGETTTLPAWLWLESPYTGLGIRAFWVSDTATFRLYENRRLPPGKLDVELRRAGSTTWERVASDVRLARAFSFDTSHLLADGENAATFFVRARLRGTVRRTAGYRLVVDHAPPEIWFPDPRLMSWGLSIDEPKTLPIPHHEPAPRIMVVGDHAAVCVEGRDDDSGLGRVRLELFDALGEPVTGEFSWCVNHTWSSDPGRYVLTATVEDRAGNVATSSAEVIGIPTYALVDHGRTTLSEVHEESGVPAALDDLDDEYGYREIINGTWGEIARMVTEQADP